MLQVIKLHELCNVMSSIERVQVTVCPFVIRLFQETAAMANPLSPPAPPHPPGGEKGGLNPQRLNPTNSRNPKSETLSLIPISSINPQTLPLSLCVPRASERAGCTARTSHFGGSWLGWPFKPKVKADVGAEYCRIVI